MQSTGQACPGKKGHRFALDPPGSHTSCLPGALQQAELLLAFPTLCSSLPSTADLKQQQIIHASSLGSVRPPLPTAPRNCSDRRDGRGKEIQARFLMGQDTWKGAAHSSTLFPSHSTLPAASHAVPEPPAPQQARADMEDCPWLCSSLFRSSRGYTRIGAAPGHPKS